MNTRKILESSRGYDPIPLDDFWYKNRVIFFNEEFTRSSCTDLIAQLLDLERDDPGKPITIYIDSPGGSVTEGLAVYDVMTSIKSPVTTVCLGMAASMGALIFLGGSRRIMLRRSKLLIHDPYISDGSSGKPLTMKEQLEKLMKTREELATIISERTGQTIEWVYDKTKTDYIMEAEEALACGACTNLASFDPDDDGYIFAGVGESA